MVNNCVQAEFTDVQCFNRYYGWYEDTGQLETIPYKMSYDLDKWYETLQKPLIVTEYGADTVPGLHTVRTQRKKPQISIHFSQSIAELY